MPFPATVHRVLVASPSDTAQYRSIARRVIEDWTALNAEAMGVALVPLLWERDSTPDWGDRPQAILNKQLVRKADALVAIFWTKLGSPTGAAESGTVEEIRECIEAGKPVLLYFSRQPVEMGSVDPDELHRLNQFRDEIRDQVLFDTFEDGDEFATKLFAALTRVARDRFGASGETTRSTGTSARSQPGADITARVEVEREFRGLAKTGSPKYRSRYLLVIANSGSAAAEDFEFHFDLPSTGTSAGREPPAILGDEGPISRFAPNSELRFVLAVHMGTAQQVELIMRWREGDETHEVSQTLRLS